MHADNATAGDKLASICAVCSQSVKHLHQTWAAVPAVNERQRAVPPGKIYIHRNQNGCHEQSKSTMKRALTVMPTKANEKQHEQEESSRCRKTKHEKESRNANAYYDLNETQSLRLLSF